MTELLKIGLSTEVKISLTLDGSGYSGLVLDKLSKAKASIGDIISLSHEGTEYTGILMPRSQVGSDSFHIVIKLKSGYNIGISIDETTIIHRKKVGTKKIATHDDIIHEDRKLPKVTILSTGGTIASKVDYQTGAVNPALSAKDLYDTVPELKNYANIQADVIMSALSENIHPSDWTKIAHSIASSIHAGVDGVVVAHGTDTLGFTSAALSFALQNLPVPVVLVGSQRSSDRPSSDAAMNLLGATALATKADAAEVMVLMHAETSDSFLHAHRGTRVRKLHTSRRDAFQSVNDCPLFKVDNLEVEELHHPLLRRDKSRKFALKPKFEEKVALLKTYPGIDNGIINYFVESAFRGLIIEGSGLGHTPDKLQGAIKNAIDAGLIVAMTSQCIFGRTNMNVYRSGVELLDIGVISCEDMLPETALAKLMWTLGNSKNSEKAKEQFLEPLAGEINMRSEISEFQLDLGGV